MYEAAFQLQRRPFVSTPDASCYFTTESITRGLIRLTDQVRSAEGLCVITAGAGLGKTLMCRKLAADLAEDHQAVFLSGGQCQSRKALLQAILYELGQPYTSREEQELRLEFQAYLKQAAQWGRRPLILIDDAHLLSDNLLQEVRTLALQTTDGPPQLRIVLSAQPALEERLIDAEYAEIAQAISCHTVIDQFNLAQSRDYLRYRLEWAGGHLEHLFSSEALDIIVQASDGVPRCLNQLADHSLLLAYVADSPKVLRQHVADALVDLRQLPLHWNPVAISADEDDLLEGTDLPGDDWEDEPDELLPEASQEIPPAAHEEPAEIYSIEIGGEPEADKPVQGAEPQQELNPEPIPLSLVAPPEVNMGPAPAVEEFEEVLELPQPVSETAPDKIHDDIPLHLPFPSPMKSEIEEERVVDRYADIDSGLPVDELSSESAADEREQLQGSSPRWTRSVNDEVHPVRPAGRSMAEHRLDALIPLIEAALDDEPADPAIAAPTPFDYSYVSSAISPAASLEETIGQTVVEICNEVRDVVVAGLQASALAERVAAADRTTETDEISASPQYDVVEPDPAPTAETQRTWQDAVPPTSENRGYKYIFSMLRRRQKLGR